MGDDETMSEAWVLYTCRRPAKSLARFAEQQRTGQAGRHCAGQHVPGALATGAFTTVSTVSTVSTNVSSIASISTSTSITTITTDTSINTINTAVAAKYEEGDEDTSQVAGAHHELEGGMRTHSQHKRREAQRMVSGSRCQAHPHIPQSRFRHR